MKNLWLTNLILLCFVVFSFSQEYQITVFSDYQKQVNLLEDTGHFEQAIQLTKDVWTHFPEREFDLMKEMIYLNTKTNRLKENLALWESGHNKGYFFLLNKQMGKYKLFINLPMFNALVQKDNLLRRAAFDKSKTIYEVILPTDFDSSCTYPLLMVLHGGGSNLEKVRRRWSITPELEQHYIVVYLQSYRAMDWNTFGWTSGDERAHRDVNKIFTEICDQYMVNTTRVLLGGMSAGGTMAFDLGLNGHLPVQGIIAFCPGKPRQMNINKSFRNGLKVFMVGGEKDYYLPKQKELTQIFDKWSISYSFKIIPGMRHSFPDDYESLMQSALDFLAF